MASKNVIQHHQLTESLGLTECVNGFWLYDETRGMNLAMKAKTERLAFTEALSYYQKRLQDVETSHKDLSLKVESFVSLFADKDEEQGYY